MRTKSMEIARPMVGMSMEAGLGDSIKRVMTCTDLLVELALQANWIAVLEGIDTRRRLLQTIIDSQPEEMHPRVAALSEAVAESERALMRVVAHAIASSRSSGALFSIYH